MKKMNIDEIKKRIIFVLKEYNVQKAGVFGSFVRGEQQANSDIDILVEFREPEEKTLLDLVGLELELTTLLNRKVDLLTYRSLHPLLKDHILSEEKVLYEERP